MNAAIQSESVFVPFDVLANSMVKSAQYLIGHRQKARRLSEMGLLDLPYVKVSKERSGVYNVGGVKCACAICAAAVILAKYWY